VTILAYLRSIGSGNATRLRTGECKEGNSDKAFACNAENANCENDDDDRGGMNRDESAKAVSIVGWHCYAG